MRGPYKDQALNVLKERGVPFETILDVGVLTGTHELSSAYPEKLHILFEPIVEFNDSIEQGYARIRHELHNVAVSDKPGTTRLEVRSIDGITNITHSGMVADGTQIEGRFYRDVTMVSLDSFLAGKDYPKPYMLKIDIDGHELSVIAGATETLKACSVLIVETPKHQLSARIRAAEAAGFELFDLAEPVYYDQAFWQCDAIMLRPEVHKQYFRDLTAGFDSKLYTKFV